MALRTTYDIAFVAAPKNAGLAETCLGVPNTDVDGLLWCREP